MKVHGRHHFMAPRAAVFAQICDPQALMAVIPGCESVVEVRPGEYEGRIVLRLPGMTGSFLTNVRLVDTIAPERSGLEGRAEGPMGTIGGRAGFELRETDGGTEIEYNGTGAITGPLARLDSRFAERLAESLIEQGLRALEARLVGKAQ
jgi:2-furoyl-CoA dehydrogenase large subunit